MSPAALSPLAVASTLVLAMLSVALFLASLRLLRGPSLPDRVVALELLATLVVGVIAVYDVATAQPVLLDVALVMALVSFLGAVAFAHYLERSTP
jgi:multicomponent Na+:H+ antiporter subunit F